MSDTPRTDAAKLIHSETDRNGGEWISADFARQIKRDAERYRWLRQQYEDKPYAVFAWDGDCAIGNEELDAAIDAAMYP